MPLVEINRGRAPVPGISNTEKMLKCSWWRKFAGIVAFIQLTCFLCLTLVFVSAAVIQVYTGTAPHQFELFRAIRHGIMVTFIHQDIMEANSFGIIGSPPLVQETVRTGIVQEGASISTNLKIMLEEADWGTLFTIYVFAALIAANQCYNGALLLRACCKWAHPKAALVLLESWRISITSFRNYLLGFLLSTLLFATDVPPVTVVILGAFWIVMCLISASVWGYYKQLSAAILDAAAVDSYEDI